MKTFKLVSVLAIFFACFLSSCSKDDTPEDNPLLGCWYVPSSPGNSLVFLEDGKAIWYERHYFPCKYEYDRESGYLLLYFLLDEYYSLSEVKWDSEIDDELSGEYVVKITGNTMQWITVPDGEYPETFMKTDKFPYQE